MSNVTSLSAKSMELYQEMLEPVMIAINHDASLVYGHVYTQDELFKMAVSLHLYALSKGKTIRVDIDTKLVILE